MNGGDETADGAVGRAVPRDDGREKVTGRARYVGDLTLPGMLEAALVRSPVPKGSIRRIDTRAARAMPGVRAVVTAADLRLPPINCTDIRYGVVVRDRPALAEQRVIFAGEPVAAVVADTRQQARTAALQVVVDVQEEPAAVTLDEAMQPGSPLVHPTGFEVEDAVYSSPMPLSYGESNIALEFGTSRGDVDTALSDCHRMFERTYRFPAVYQYAMEPFTVLAHATDAVIQVWSTAQHPSQVTRDLARIFGVDVNRVRVAVPNVGGGFGSKSFTHIEPLTVALSRAVDRPVRLELDVAEAMTVSRRHNAIVRVRSGVDGDGRLVAYDLDLAYDTGAYTLLGPYVVAKGVFRGLGAYDFEHYRARGRLVFTNTSPAGSMRAVGGPQAAFALESHLDELAVELGVDPLDLRRAHVARRGREFRSGRTPMDADIHEDLALLEGMARDLDTGTPPAATRSGTGFAMGVADPGASPVSSAVVRLAADGSVTVLVGSTELGQGVRTVVRQVAADALGVAYERVAVTATDTGFGPYDASTGASRSTSMSGLAVVRAAGQIKARLTAMAREEWACSGGDVDVRDGVVVGPDGRKAEIEHFVHRHFGQNGGNFYGIGEVTAAEFATTPPFWEVGAGAATVWVDTETGQVRLTGYASVADVGKAVNPALLAGQERGAIVQGIGHTLYEALEWEDGHLVNDSLVEYRVPRIGDVPTAFTEAFVENADGPGPFGAKGAGEGGILPVGAAVANAVRDATGVRMTELPLTPERVWRALRDREEDSRER